MTVEVDVSHIEKALPAGREQFLLAELPRHLKEFYSRRTLYFLVQTGRIKSKPITPHKTYVSRSAILDYFKKALRART